MPLGENIGDYGPPERRHGVRPRESDPTRAVGWAMAALLIAAVVVTVWAGSMVRW